MIAVMASGEFVEVFMEQFVWIQGEQSTANVYSRRDGRRYFTPAVTAKTHGLSVGA
jgi:hypothetical protein